MLLRHLLRSGLLRIRGGSSVPPSQTCSSRGLPTLSPSCTLTALKLIPGISIPITIAYFTSQTAGKVSRRVGWLSSYWDWPRCTRRWGCSRHFRDGSSACCSSRWCCFFALLCWAGDIHFGLFDFVTAIIASRAVAARVSGCRDHGLLAELVAANVSVLHHLAIAGGSAAMRPGFVLYSDWLWPRSSFTVSGGFLRDCRCRVRDPGWCNQASHGFVLIAMRFTSSVLTGDGSIAGASDSVWPRRSICLFVLSQIAPQRDRSFPRSDGVSGGGLSFPSRSRSGGALVQLRRSCDSRREADE